MASSSWILPWTIIGVFIQCAGAFNYSNQTGSLRESVICLTEETSNEVFLSCEQGSVIYLLDHVLGYQEVPPNTHVCSEPEQEDECQSSNDAVAEILRDACMGRTECRPLVDKVFLAACGRYSDYTHIAYNCITSNSLDQYNMVDVCGDMLSGHVVSRSSGYLETPNYPDPYPPDVTCTCNLTTLQPTGEVFLRVLDLEMEPGSPCGNDWVEYTVPGQNASTKLCTSTASDAFSTGSNTIFIKFKADQQIEGRGFWLMYEGKQPDGSVTEVRMDCSHNLPIEIKNATLCHPLQNSSEIYLDCREVGVIDVLTTQHGYKDWAQDEECSLVLDDPCAVQANIRDHVMASCMGQGTCVVSVTMIMLPTCNMMSNYFQVRYKCIPNVQDPNVIIDICGDSINAGSIRRSHGYIESPNYPANYPPNLACYCFLATDADAHIRIHMLDVQIAGASTNGICGNDWLEFRQSNQAGSSGRHVCDESLGQWIHTDGNEVYIKFSSDDLLEERGFWFEYSGRKSITSAETEVEVSCRQTTIHPPEGQSTGPPDVSDSGGDGGDDGHHQGGNRPSDAASAPSSAQANIGLIVGLCFIGGLMLLVIIIMIILRYRKIREDKAPAVTETTAQVDTPLDKSYNTLKKYSAVASSKLNASQNYSELHNESRSSSLRGSIGKGLADGRTEVDTITGSTVPASYINPSFDGSLEGGNPMPNPTV